MEFSPLVTALPIISIGILSLIFYFKFRYQKKKANPDKSKNWIANRTKYPEVNVFRFRPIFFKMGLVASLSLTLMAFSWTTYEKKGPGIYFDDLIMDELEIEPPRTIDRPKPPPPPPPPIIEEVPEVIVEDQPELIDMSIEADEEIEPIIEEPIVEEIEAPLPPPPVEEEEPEIFSFAEEMPRFPGCDSGTKKEKKKCSYKALFTYLAKNLKYPTIAKENGIEGKLTVQFTVNTDGTVQDAVVFREIGGGCGQAALDVVNGMNNMKQKWVPGKQRGKTVRVKFTLPVTFRLN